MNIGVIGGQPVSPTSGCGRGELEHLFSRVIVCLGRGVEDTREEVMAIVHHRAAPAGGGASFLSLHPAQDSKEQGLPQAAEKLGEKR